MTTDPAPSRRGLFVLFLYAMAAALVTAGLLFLNGGLVMALLNVVTQGGASWLRDERFMQFALFAGPVLLVVVEWMMIDFLRTRLWRSR